MNYKFPEIRTIDDVLPHIEGREEFVVAEREFGTVINYVVSMSTTFDMEGPDDLGGAIRRECRGIIFYPDGHIMSRAFHKFFNTNEREETQTHAIDMTQEHVVMEKMDGSMIRGVLVDGELRLGTKMGVTTVSEQAEEWFFAQSDVDVKTDFLKNGMRAGVTDLFEWVSPDNQIVLTYDQADLVYLGSRDNFTGEYWFDEAAPFTKVPRYGSVNGNLSEYLDRQRQAEDREGDIIRFADGHMLKIKNDWYVRIHKALDRVRFDRNIVNLIINEELDDVVPLMPQQEIDRIQLFERHFWASFEGTEQRLRTLFNMAQEYTSRKSIALEFIPTLSRKEDAQFIFRMLDEKDLRQLMLEHVHKSIGSNTKWDLCAEWLGM